MNVSPTKKAEGIVRGSYGSFTSDGTAAVIALGFVPSYIVVMNSTDVIRWEKFQGMAAANSVAITGTPTVSLNTASQILFNADGTVTLGATLVGTAKAISWFAE